MLELTPAQVAVLERLLAHGFRGVAFPLYESFVGVQKGNCAALLQPLKGGGMKILGEPSYLLEGDLSVVVRRGAQRWFTWKKKQIEATPERLAELAQFKEELANLLLGAA